MKRYSVFAHYDVSGSVHDYVFFYLQELKQVSDAIIFVSDGTIKSQDKEKLSKYVDVISDEKHGEYDWGSYKKGYLAIKDKLTDKDELIFCNDIPYFSIFKHFIKKDSFEVYNDSVIYLIKNGFPFIKKLSFKNKKNYLNILYPYMTNNYDTKYIEDYFSFKRLNGNLNLLFKLIMITILKMSPTKHFFFSDKITKSGKRIIKICKIPVYRRKIK